LYDVAVIGGGPVGSQVAYRLAGAGRSVVVVEQKANLGEPVCCAGIISQECVSQFAIEKELIYRPANSARIFSPSGKVLRVWRPEPQAHIVDRSAFNLAFAKRAREKGAQYALNSPVKSIEVLDNAVRIESEHGRGKFDRFEAKALVIANGFGSRLVEALGLGKVGDFTVGAQAEVEIAGIDEVEVYLGKKIAPAFFAWLVPISPQRALAGLLSRNRAGFYLRRLLESLKTQGKITSDEVEPSYAGVALGPLSRTYDDRILVVGSAAGQAKPTTGGGIYYGLLCADIAADCLHRALENDALSAKDLAIYEKGWKRKLGNELRVGRWSRRFFELLSDKRIDNIFDIMISNEIDKALLESDEVAFDWHYRAVLKLIGYRALDRTFKIMKLPFPSIGRN